MVPFILLKILLKMPLTFIINNNNTRSLLYRNHLYWHSSLNYWRCVLCPSTVSTTGETETDDIKRVGKLPHDHHEMSKAEIECKKAITRIKQHVVIFH